MDALDLIYDYRRLLAKCESSAGLSLDEIERFSNLEDLLSGQARVELAAFVRSRRFQDPVLLDVIDRSGAICVGCPYLEEGQVIELRIEADDRSFRFAARVQWVRDDGNEDYEVGLSFESAPVLVRHATREFPTPMIAAAAEAA